MDNYGISNTLDTEEKLNQKTKSNSGIDSINASFDSAYKWDTETSRYITEDTSNFSSSTYLNRVSEFKIEENNEVTSLTTLRERRLLTAQTMFKKTIRVSLKSFLLSISLTFLNFFV